MIRQTWEYKYIVEYVPLGEDELNELGADGWELVSVMGDTQDWRYFFKRPKGERDFITLTRKQPAKATPEELADPPISGTSLYLDLANWLHDADMMEAIKEKYQRLRLGEAPKSKQPQTVGTPIVIDTDDALGSTPSEATNHGVLSRDY